MLKMVGSSAFSAGTNEVNTVKCGMWMSCVLSFYCESVVKYAGSLPQEKK